ncbi:hypothetical protein [Kitasatospora cineracea]|uniref:Uncharacterized protein n=1 Tax=Kitasatospora cineracea TaxID=88074 RepID=A0A3N4R3X4_9ACTN|nr:hypothetical protein [Kitasatospora cineracea]RPE27296.1 hypothetical protein EDD38_7441 [Kitasatospora cineracea]
MARLQILHLPPRPGRPAPFALVVDQTDKDGLGDVLALENGARRMRDQLGAEAVLCFAFTVDVANTTELTVEAGPTDVPCCAQRETEVTL